MDTTRPTFENHWFDHSKKLLKGIPTQWDEIFKSHSVNDFQVRHQTVKISRVFLFLRYFFTHTVCRSRHDNAACSCAAKMHLTLSKNLLQLKLHHRHSFIHLFLLR